MPDDIQTLWAAYRQLTPNLRRQFLSAAAKWQESSDAWQIRRTLSFALRVVACEALKPPGPEYNDHNIYDVIEALIDKAASERLRAPGFEAQDVRNAHLHVGAFRSTEFAEQMAMSTFIDPSFDQASRDLARITQAAIIEWLRRGGVYALPPKKRKKAGPPAQSDSDKTKLAGPSANRIARERLDRACLRLERHAPVSHAHRARIMPSDRIQHLVLNADL